MGSGISVYNDTNIEIFAVLSQAGPLHWANITPGKTECISCGQVLFTLDVHLVGHKSEPSKWDVAKPFVIGFGAGVGLIAGGLIAAVPAVATAAGASIGVAIKTASVGAGLAGTSMATATGVTAGALSVVVYQENQKKREVAKQENVTKWLKLTPSERNADWLAENEITEVIPAKMSGIYADGKIVTVIGKIEDTDCGSRQLVLMIKLLDNKKEN